MLNSRNDGNSGYCRVLGDLRSRQQYRIVAYVFRFRSGCAAVQIAEEETESLQYSKVDKCLLTLIYHIVIYMLI